MEGLDYEIVQEAPPPPQEMPKYQPRPEQVGDVTRLGRKQGPYRPKPPPLPGPVAPDYEIIQEAEPLGPPAPPPPSFSDVYLPHNLQQAVTAAQPLASWYAGSSALSEGLGRLAGMVPRGDSPTGKVIGGLLGMKFGGLLDKPEETAETMGTMAASTAQAGLGLGAAFADPGMQALTVGALVPFPPTQVPSAALLAGIMAHGFYKSGENIYKNYTGPGQFDVQQALTDSLNMYLMGKGVKHTGTELVKGGYEFGKAKFGGQTESGKIATNPDVNPEFSRQNLGWLGKIREVLSNIAGAPTGMDTVRWKEAKLREADARMLAERLAKRGEQPPTPPTVPVVPPSQPLQQPTLHPQQPQPQQQEQPQPQTVMTVEGPVQVFPDLNKPIGSVQVQQPEPVVVPPAAPKPEVTLTPPPKESPTYATQGEGRDEGRVPLGQEPRRPLQVPQPGQETTPAGGVLQAPQGQVGIPADKRVGSFEPRPVTGNIRDLEHDLNNMAVIINENKRMEVITPNQAVKFKAASSSIYKKVQAGEYSVEEGQKRVAQILEDIGNIRETPMEMKGRQKPPGGRSEEVIQGEMDRLSEKLSTMMDEPNYMDNPFFRSLLDKQVELNREMDVKQREQGIVPMEEPPKGPIPPGFGDMLKEQVDAKKREIAARKQNEQNKRRHDLIRFLTGEEPPKKGPEGIMEMKARPQEDRRGAIVRSYDQAIRDLNSRGVRNADITVEQDGYILSFSDNQQKWYTGPGARRRKGEEVKLYVNQVFVPGRLDEAAVIAEHLPNLNAFHKAEVSKLVDETLGREPKDYRKIRPSPEEQSGKFLEEVSKPQYTFANRYKAQQLEEEIKSWKKDRAAHQEIYDKATVEPYKSNIKETLDHYDKQIGKMEAKLATLERGKKSFGGQPSEIQELPARQGRPPGPGGDEPYGPMNKGKPGKLEKIRIELEKAQKELEAANYQTPNLEALQDNVARLERELEEAADDFPEQLLPGVEEDSYRAAKEQFMKDAEKEYFTRPTPMTEFEEGARGMSTKELEKWLDNIGYGIERYKKAYTSSQDQQLRGWIEAAENRRDFIQRELDIRGRTGEDIVTEMKARVPKKDLTDLDPDYRPPMFSKKSGKIDYSTMRDASVARVLDLVETGIYTGRNLSIVARELVQNMRDAYQDHSGERTMREVKTQYGSMYGVMDEGKGMDATTFLTKYLPPVTSGKGVGEGGGFGLAKSIVLGRPEKYTMRTVAKDSQDGKMYAITMKGTGPGWKQYAKDFLKGDLPEEAADSNFSEVVFNENLKATRVEVPKGTPSGTMFLLSDSTFDYSTRTHGPYEVLHPSFKTRATEFDSARATGKLMQLMENPDNEVFKDMVEKPKGMVESDASKHAFKTVEHAKSFTKTYSEAETDNFSMEMIYDPDAEVKERSNVNAHILSNGSFQFTAQLPVGQSYGDTAILPSDMVVDVKPKVPAVHKDYPFTASRDAVKGEVLRQITKAFKDAVQTAKDKIKDAYRKAAEHVVSDSGVKYVNFFKEVGPDFVNKTEAEAPVVKKMYEFVQGSFMKYNQNLIDVFEQADKVPQEEKFLYPHGTDIRDAVTAKPGGLTTRNNVLGVNVFDPVERTYKSYLNPYTLARTSLEISKAAHVPVEEVFARMIVETLAHEVTHNLIRDEGEPLSRAFTFLQHARARHLLDDYQKVVRELYREDNLTEQLENLTKQEKELEAYDVSTEVSVFTSGKERSDWTQPGGGQILGGRGRPVGRGVQRGNEGVGGGEETRPEAGLPTGGVRGGAPPGAVPPIISPPVGGGAGGVPPRQGHIVTPTPGGGGGPPNPMNVAPSQVSLGLMKQTVGQKAQGVFNKWRGYSAPKHAAASEKVADKLVRYASSTIAAPEVAKSMATDVLGPKHYRDQVFDKNLGAVLTEDRLRAVKKAFEELAAKSTDPVEQAELLDKAQSVNTTVRQPYSVLKTEADYQRLLNDPEIKAALDRHKTTIQTMAEEMHQKLNAEHERLMKLAEKERDPRKKAALLAKAGEAGLARPGEQTQAFVNLLAIMAPDTVESARSMIFGSRRGNLANPRLRPSVFGKEAKGTGWMYEQSYRKLAERMVRGNYEQAALKDYYESMKEAKLAVEAPTGAPPPVGPNGVKYKKVEIKPGRAFLSGKNIWVRPDLEPEMRRALDVDQVDKMGIGALTDLATQVQVTGPTDLAWHAVNMMAVLGGSQGAKSMFRDIARKSTPLGFLDGFIRMGYNGVQSLIDRPEYQKIIADYTKIGAGRARPVHKGGVLRGAARVFGVPEKAAEKLNYIDPTAGLGWISSHLLKHLDTGGRIAASKMYDNLVKRGMIEDTELNKREFINRLGQYNSRLMPQWQAIMRENSLSSFVVAGKNMNRQAIRRIMTSPGFKAANPEAFAKARLVELLSLASLTWALPVAMNLAINGKGNPWGRNNGAGIPAGAVDLGEDDEKGRPKYFDPSQSMLARRGLRNIGIDALRRAQQEHLGVAKTAKEVLHDIFAGIIHPWAGPSVRTAAVGFTGKDIPSGYLESRNPTDWMENLLAAVKNSNPTLAAYFKGKEEGMAPAAAQSKQLKGALGFKTGRAPTHGQMLEKEVVKRGAPSVEEAGIKIRRQAEQAVEKGKLPKSELATRAGAERNLWENFMRQDRIHDALPEHQQAWLKEHNLTVPGYENEVTLLGVRLGATEKEAEFMQKAVVKEYSKAIDVAMKRVGTPTQARLDKLLDFYRARARVGLRKLMNEPVRNRAMTNQVAPAAP